MNEIAKQTVELEKLFNQIPPEHRGILFERVLKTVHPQESTRRLELAFATLWAEENERSNGQDLLSSLLIPVSNIWDDRYLYDPKRPQVPQNEREWEVAQLVAATVVQWLPTACGCAFLERAFQNGGGSFSYTLPEISPEEE